MARLNVLHVNKLYDPWVGGVEACVKDLAGGLAERGYGVEVLVCQPRGRGRSDTVDGVPVRRAASLGMALGMPVSPTFVPLLARRAAEAHVVHVHVPFPLAAAAALLEPRMDFRLVVHFHSDIVRQRRLRELYDATLRRLLRAADRVIVTSPRLLTSSAAAAAAADKAVVVPYGIHPFALPSAARCAELRRSLGLQTGDRVILFVGRLVYYKGVEHLVAAVAGLDAHLVIVGDGVLRHELQSQAARLGVSRRVRFVGEKSRDEAREYYGIADVFVLPSVAPTEAFGIVQIEAMSAGLPVVNTSLPTGVPWVSRHGQTGLTVAPADQSSLRSALARLLGDDALRRRLSTAARARASEFSIEGMVDRVAAVYADLGIVVPRERPLDDGRKDHAIA